MQDSAERENIANKRHKEKEREKSREKTTREEEEAVDLYIFQ
jgi:hypothetical protein